MTGITDTETVLKLRELRAFGRAADKDELKSIYVEPGGFINPGRGSSHELDLGKEKWQHVEGEGRTSSEGGSEAGQGQGRRAPAEAPARSAAPALGRRIADALRLGELQEWYPEIRVSRSAPNLTLLTVPVEIFRTLPYRARLFVEIPHDGPFRLPGPGYGYWYHGRTFVPDIRVWAMWDMGVVPQAYHRYPDLSICAYMEGEWIWSRDPLHDYLDWCLCWLARVLHLQYFDRWPGPQHCSANVRVKRNRPDEFCGCGSEKRWRDCCMEEDLSRSPYHRFMEEQRGRDGYLFELERRGLSATPPWKRTT